MVTSNKKMLKYEFILNAVFGTFCFFTSVGSLFLIINLKRTGEITIGDFALVIGLMPHMFWHCLLVILNLKEFIKKNGELVESFSILDDSFQNQDNQNKQKLKFSRSNISFDNILFSYDKKTKVFSNLNLNIKSGEKNWIGWKVRSWKIHFD